MKTSELTGALLDYWVAKAESEEPQLHTYDDKQICVIFCREFSPSDNWAQGGPLLDKYAVGFRPLSDAEWEAEEYITAHTGRGPTQLIASMRVIVSSVYGDTVPDEVAA